MAWSLLAHTGQGSTNQSTFTTSAIDTTGADLLVVQVVDSNHGTTLSDNKGNTWVSAAGPTTTNGPDAQLYYATNPIVGTGHTFTATVTSQSPALLVQAWSGSGSSPLDQTNFANGLFVSTLQPGSVTPGQNGELIVTGQCSGSTSGSSSVNLGFTISDSFLQVNGQHVGGALAYLVQGTAAAINPTWTGTGLNFTGATIATFKAAAAAATYPLISEPYRARLRVTPARTIVGYPPPPTIPAPRPATPRQSFRPLSEPTPRAFRYGIPPPNQAPYVAHPRQAFRPLSEPTPGRFIVGRPPPNPSPAGAFPRQVNRARFLLPPDQFRSGKPPPPPVAPPRPATPRQSFRALFLLPLARTIKGWLPPLSPGVPRPVTPLQSFRAPLRVTPARTIVGRPPPPTVPAPRPFTPRQVFRAVFLLPPDRFIVGRPPVPPIPPGPARPRQQFRPLSEPTPGRFRAGFPPPPPLAPPRPAQGIVTRARPLLPRSRTTAALTAPPAITQAPLRPYVTRARLGSLPGSRTRVGRPPPPVVPVGRPAAGVVTRAKLGPLPRARTTVGLVPRGAPGPPPVTVAVQVVGPTGNPPRAGAPNQPGRDDGIRVQ